MATPTADVVVIGAGIVGAACAHALTEAGLRVAVVDRGGIAGGTTSAGEGNILVSDKAPGAGARARPALRGAVAGARDQLGEDALEYEPKGGVVVARQRRRSTPRDLGASQRAAGVTVEAVDRLAWQRSSRT